MCMFSRDGEVVAVAPFPEKKTAKKLKKVQAVCDALNLTARGVCVDMSEPGRALEKAAKVRDVIATVVKRRHMKQSKHVVKQ